MQSWSLLGISIISEDWKQAAADILLIVLEVNPTLISLSMSFIFHKLKELFETDERIITRHKRPIIIFTDTPGSTRSVWLHLLTVCQAHWVVSARSHCIRIVDLINILYFRYLADTTSKNATILLILVALITKTKNLLIGQERELPQFADFSHLRWVCQFVPHWIEALPNTHDVL